MADTLTVSTAEVARAAAELRRMRSSLASWLRYRAINDRVLAGTATTKKPLAYAQQVVSAARDMALEQNLASKLAALLGRVMPGVTLPSSDVSRNPDAAVQLANLALRGSSPDAAPAQGMSGFPGAGHPWLWPVLIVGGLLLVITTAIRSAADVAKDKEEKACIEAGACTDYGFWLKAGGIAALAWFAWRELGLGEVVRGAIHRKKGHR